MLKKIMIVLGVILLIGAVVAPAARAAVPSTVNVQGVIEPIPDEGTPIYFRFVKDSANLTSSPFASEITRVGPDANKVYVDDKGFFNYQLDLSGVADLSQTLAGGTGPVRLMIYVGSTTNLVGTHDVTPVLTAVYAERAAVADSLADGASVWTVDGDNVYRTAGRVGIGTSAPAHRLHIRSAGETGLYLEGDANNSKGDEDQNAFIKMSQDNQLVMGYLGFVGAAGNDPEENTYTGALNNGLLLGTTTNHPLQLGANGAARLTVGTDGNVGISKAAPEAPLDVNGQIRTNSSLSVRNPNNEDASVNLNWQDNVARIRYGGNGVGNEGGLDIQGPGDASKMRILHNGNVGIGTTSPAARLHVANGGAVIGQTSNVGYKDIEENGNDLIVNGQLAVGGSGGSAIYKLGIGYAPPANEGDLIASRYLGVGTDAPETRLHVNNTSTASSGYNMFRLSSVTHAIASMQGGQDDDGLANCEVSLNFSKKINADTSLAWKIGMDNDNNAGSSDLFIIKTANNENPEFCIDRDGKVGLGTVSPQKRLHVGGDMAVSDTAAASLMLKATDASDANKYGFYSLNASSINGDFKIDSLSGSWAQPSSSTRLLINSSGNIGIGTVLPAAKLDVSGGSGTLARLGYIISDVGGVTRYGVYAASDSTASGSSVGLYARGDDRGIFVMGPTNYIEGKLGIGTSSPDEKLEVNGNAMLYGATSASLYLKDNSQTLGSTWRLLSMDKKLFFRTNDASSSVVYNKMVIDAEGDVGIGSGVTAASEKLHVLGKGRFNEGVIAGNTASPVKIFKFRTSFPGSGTQYISVTETVNNVYHIAGSWSSGGGWRADYDGDGIGIWYEFAGNRIKIESSNSGRDVAGILIYD